MRPVEAAEQFGDMEFPAQGVDLSDEYGGQLRVTTRAGENVRVFEYLTDRGRGGSRPGMVKWLPDPVSEAGSAVQHLAVLVTADAAFSLAADEGCDNWDDSDCEADPSTNVRYDQTGDARLFRNGGRRLRYGGSGIQPKRTRPYQDPRPNAVTPGTITIFVQEDKSFTFHPAATPGDTVTGTFINDFTGTVPAGIIIYKVGLTGFYHWGPAG